MSHECEGVHQPFCVKARVIVACVPGRATVLTAAAAEGAQEGLATVGLDTKREQSLRGS